MYGSLGSERYISTYACGPGNQHLAISAEKLEWYVESQVLHHIFRRAEEAAYADGVVPEVERPLWPGQNRLDIIDEKISELWAAYRADQLSLSVVLPQTDALKVEQSELEKEKLLFGAANAEAVSAFSDSHQVWNHYSTMPSTDKELLFRRELLAVVVAKGKRGRDGWGAAAFEERLKFEWRTNVAEPAWPVKAESMRIPGDEWPAAIAEPEGSDGD
jgi:hypothetical protein